MANPSVQILFVVVFYFIFFSSKKPCRFDVISGVFPFSVTVHCLLYVSASDLRFVVHPHFSPYRGHAYACAVSRCRSSAISLPSMYVFMRPVDVAVCLYRQYLIDILY